MGTVGFVAGEQIDIGAQLFDIRQAVRGVADAINTDKCPCRVGGGGDFCNGVDLAHHVRAMREADQADVFIEQINKVVSVQMSGVGVNLPFTYVNAFVGQTTPRTCVRLVVLIGHDNRLARLHPLAKSVGQNISVLSG